LERASRSRTSSAAKTMATARMIQPHGVELEEDVATVVVVVG
jgi:hypothetical protein